MDTEGNSSVSDWSYRKDHTPEWRAAVVHHSIDPGFVHHRKIETNLGSQGMSIIDEQIRNLPQNLPDWQRPVRIDHIYTRAMLTFCKALNIKSLRQIMAKREGHLFCSNEELGPARPLSEGRVANEILLETVLQSMLSFSIPQSTCLAQRLGSGYTMVDSLSQSLLSFRDSEKT